MNAVTTTELAVLEPGHDRKKFLGGSDIAAVMGLSPWQTPVELWQEKTGRTEREEPDAARLRMFERGHKLEPFIRDMAIAKLESMGLQVELVNSNQRYVDSALPFLACEIDFELRLTGEVDIGGKSYTFDHEVVNADAKSVTGFARKKWGEESTEDVPIEYAAQFMHGLGILGRRACLVAALRSFDDVDIYWTLADQETIEAMRARADVFWNQHVLADVAPDPLEFSDIKALFPLDNGQAVDATPEIAQKVADLRRVKASIKDLEEQAEVLQFEVANFISPHAILKFDGREIATWKGQGDTRLSQDVLSKAEIYRRNEESGEFEPITNPVAEFSRTKTIRVLRLKKGT